MKLLFLFLSILVSPSFMLAQAYTQPPAVPTTSPNPEFPLHVHIFSIRWNYVRGGYEGYGRGDLLGDKPTGFDYTFSCSEPFLHNAQRSEFYLARWKKQDQKLELLMLKVGSSHEEKCELKVAMKSAPYGKYGPAAAAPATPPNVQ